MVAPGIRDPDEVQIIGGLRDDLKKLAATVVARWGRVPYAATDPTTPADGTIWLRSDVPATMWARISGASRAIGVASDWIAASALLVNGYTNFGGGNTVAGYRRVGDRVEIRGLLAVPAGGVVISSTVFTLPAGYRPTGTETFTTLSSVSGLGEAARRVDITAAGVIVCNFAFPAAAGQYLSLAGLSFSIN